MNGLSWFQINAFYMYNAKSRISSVGRVLDCRTGGRGFDSRGQTNTQGLKIIEKGRYCIGPEAARPSHGWDDYVK